MPDKRKTARCPECGSDLIARETTPDEDYIICVKNGCDWRVIAKRFEDATIPLHKPTNELK